MSRVDRPPDPGRDGARAGGCGDPPKEKFIGVGNAGSVRGRAGASGDGARCGDGGRGTTMASAGRSGCRGTGGAGGGGGGISPLATGAGGDGTDGTLGNGTVSGGTVRGTGGGTGMGAASGVGGGGTAAARGVGRGVGTGGISAGAPGTICGLTCGAPGALPFSNTIATVEGGGRPSFGRSYCTDTIASSRSVRCTHSEATTILSSRERRRAIGRQGRSAVTMGWTV